MKIFEEKQRFDQWWLYVVYAIVIGGLIIGIYQNSDGFQNFDNPPLILFFFAGFIPIVFILSLRLETRMDSKGIRVKFYPLGFTEKFFSWSEMEECYVREYSPLLEYGGWGIRGLGRKKAYNVSGNIGIQIVTSNKKKFLIGTNEPDAAKAVILNYRSKNRLTPNKNLA